MDERLNPFKITRTRPVARIQLFFLYQSGSFKAEEAEPKLGLIPENNIGSF